MRSETFKGGYFNLAAFLPSLLQTAFWLLVEAVWVLLISLAIALLVHRTPLDWVLSLAALVVITTIGEIARRRPGVSWRIAKMGWRLWHSARRFSARLRGWPEAPAAVFWLLTVVYVWVLAPRLAAGLQSPLDNKPAEASALFSAALSLIAGIIAIFFAGAVLAVQLITGSYSSEFVRVFVRRPVFLASLLIMVLVAVGQLLLLGIGWNAALTTGSMVSAVYAVLCLGCLVWLLTDFLHMPRLAQIVGRQIRGYINSGLPRPIRALRVDPDAPGFELTIRQRARVLFDVHILGTLSSLSFESFAALQVPSHFQEELSERTRPLLSACLRAIQQDRRDVATVCLNELVDIARAYLRARYNYSDMGDRYLLFLVGQLEILFAASLGQTNEQFTSDIVAAAIQIGQATIPLTATQFRPYENGLTLPWSEVLMKSALRLMSLQHTNAPLAACDGIAILGRALLRHGAYSTVLYGVEDKLRTIGVTAASARDAWSATIAQKAAHGYVLLISDCYVLAEEERYYYEYAVDHLCKGLQEILHRAYDARSDWNTLTLIPAPIVGSLWQAGTLVDVFRNGLSVTPKGKLWERLALVRDLSFLVEVVRRVGVHAISKGGASYEYSVALSEMLWSAVAAARTGQDPAVMGEIRKLIAFLILAAQGFVSTSIEAAPDKTYDHLSKLSPVYAFLMYFSRAGERPGFFHELEHALQGLAELAERLSVEEDDRYRAREQLVSYLKMYGAWMHRYYPARPVTKHLTGLIASIAAQREIGRDPVFLSEMELLGYPTAFPVDHWYIFRSRFWSPQQEAIAAELNDIASYRRYDQLIRRKRKRTIINRQPGTKTGEVASVDASPEPTG